MTDQAATQVWEPPVVAIHRRRTAILVLACLAEVYTKCVRAIRDTWAAEPSSEVDIFFVYGAKSSKDRPGHLRIDQLIGGPGPRLEDNEAWSDSDIILCGCADGVEDQSDCLLRKRLIAFGHLANQGKYDFIYTICASSYVDTHELANYVGDLPLTGVYHGPVGVCGSTGYPYISGTSILLSRDMAAYLADSFDDIVAFNDGAYADDVAIGHWIAENYCGASLSEICDKIHSGEQGFADQAFVLPYGKGLVNFVNRPVEEHLPAEQLYHYHFDSRHIGHMESFHRKFFHSIS